MRDCDGPDMKAMSAATYAPSTRGRASPTRPAWSSVLGTGHRATVEQLEPAAAQRVRTASVGWVREHEVRELQVNVVCAQALKPDRHQPETAAGRV